MARRNINAGFTLIEVLIAMTLLGVMVVLLFSSMKICADSWQKGEDKITQVNDTAVVYQFFQHHVGTAKPVWNDFSEDNQDFAFQGKSQELQFVSAFPASAQKSGLQLFSLNLVKEGDDQRLQVSIIPFYPPAKGEEWHKEDVTLLENVRNFSLTYFSLDETQTEGSWQEDWQEQETLPRLVKIKIETEDGNYWPEMIIPLKAEPTKAGSDELDLDEDEQDEQDVEQSLIEDVQQ